MVPSLARDGLQILAMTLTDASVVCRNNFYIQTITFRGISLFKMQNVPKPWQSLQPSYRGIGSSPIWTSPSFGPPSSRVLSRSFPSCRSPSL